jgi:hypothetical protein
MPDKVMKFEMALCRLDQRPAWGKAASGEMNWLHPWRESKFHNSRREFEHHLDNELAGVLADAFNAIADRLVELEERAGIISK